MNLVKHFWMLFALPLGVVMGMVLPLRLLAVLAVVGMGSIVCRRLGILMAMMLTMSGYSQGFGSYGNLPLLSGSSAPSLEPLLPSTIAHDWDASTLTNGNTFVWTDKIQGWNFYTISATPPVASGGVLNFSKANHTRMQMTNLLFNGGNGDSMLIVCLLTNADTEVNIWATSSTGGNIFSEIMNFFGNIEWYRNYPLYQKTNVVFDQLFVSKAGVIPSGRIYTNGVQAYDVGNNAGLGNYGTAGTGFSGLDYLGSVGNGNDLGGYVQRIIHWTNNPAFLTTEQISNIHYYVQQKYGVTP